MKRKIPTRNAAVDETSERIREKPRDGLDGIVRKSLPQETPGVALLVMNGDDIVLLKGYGNGRIGYSKENIKRQKVTERTVFELASLSKQFTALAILMLIDGTTTKGPNRGKYERLDFRSKLSRFFPNLPRANEITIQHLLDHSSGLPDYLSLKIGSKKKFAKWYDNAQKSTGYWYAKMSGGRGRMTNKDVIDLVAKHRRLDFTPGTKYAYSDTGYVVLAEIVRNVTGKRLGQFLKDEVFDRLGMSNTFVFDESYGGLASHALCYRRSNVTYKSINSNTVFNYIHGDGNVHSTIGDLVLWLKAWNRIDDIRAHGIQKLIKKDTLIRLFKPRAVGDRRKHMYAAGFFVDRYKNGYALSHGGDWLGFHSYLMRANVYLPSNSSVPMKKARKLVHRQQSILVLANYSVLSKYDGVDPFLLARELADVFWNLPRKYNLLKRIRYPA